MKMEVSKCRCVFGEKKQELQCRNLFPSHTVITKNCNPLAIAKSITNDRPKQVHIVHIKGGASSTVCGSNKCLGKIPNVNHETPPPARYMIYDVNSYRMVKA